MKKLKCALAAILMCLTACLCGACNKEEEQPAATATQNTQTFITIVSQIPDQVTVDYGYKIEAALLVYDYLNDSEKDNPDVSASKTRLDGLKTQYDVVKAEADKQAEIAREDRLVLSFITDVNGLPSLNKLKLDDKDTVEELLEKYGQLKDESKQKSEVVAAYAKLLQVEKKIAELEEEARQEVIQAAAEKFIKAIQDTLEAIEEADAEDRGEAILAAGDTIKDLLEDYKDFEDDVIAYEGVAEAKAALDELYAEYADLFDANAVKEFLELVAALPPAEQITLEHERAITKAEAAYDNISATSQETANVAQAYAVLQQAREKFNVLFEAAEAIRVQEFIAAANNVRTNIEDVDILWFDELDAASKAYWALKSDASYELPEVVEAFERWNAAQKAFDKKGYERIPMSEPTLVYSGDVPPHIVLQNHANMLNPVVELYKLSSYTEISQYAKVWLNVYVDGTYVARGELDTSKFIDSGHIIPGSEVVNVLQALSAEHTEIHSGASFSFTMNFEDRENKYIPSNQTKVSQSKVYTW